MPLVVVRATELADYACHGALHGQRRIVAVRRQTLEHLGQPLGHAVRHQRDQRTESQRTGVSQL
eukprot:CAMPEP_0174233152 /NCGR_PEP_ID=MMETSP0417-20130205/3265_1 /TAXON_ID=242541 /ORGANISM="Mayorella sp, Strain BSH-02190019" /LENGTH=63 /DNA_ID=CAMNT_0015311319 /DNA_START=101 /DNA_END=288 /DNA_ORIENTATION=+